MPRNNTRSERIIPQIHVLGTSDNLCNELGTDPVFISYYYEHLCKGIFEGFSRDADAAVIFEQTNSRTQHLLARKQWPAALRSAIRYYESRESYETCRCILELQQRLN